MICTEIKFYQTTDEIVTFAELCVLGISRQTSNSSDILSNACFEADNAYYIYFNR